MICNQEQGLLGSTQQLAWAWDKPLPPKQKLVLIYIANGHTTPRQADHNAIAAFAGIAAREVPGLLKSLQRRRLIFAEDGYAAIRTSTFDHP